MVAPFRTHAALLCAAVIATLGACSESSVSPDSASPDSAAARAAGPASDHRLTVDNGKLPDAKAAMELGLADAGKRLEGLDLSGAIDSMESFTKSDLYLSLQPLLEFVEGRTVAGSDSGNAGFLLRLDGDRWAAAYLEGGKVAHAKGTGEPPETVRSALRSTQYGDATDPISGASKDANRSCDIPAELRKAHGQTLKGLVFLADSFNFSFRGGSQLDLRLVDDANGKPAYRVYWK